MSEELRAARERRRKLMADPKFDISEHDYMIWDHDYMRDLVMLANDNVAANPADDDELADGDFVRSLGKILRDDKDCVIVQIKESFEMRVQVLWESDWTKKKWRCIVRAYRHSLVGAIIVETPTRGHVRRLLAALGVELKEAREG